MTRRRFHFLRRAWRRRGHTWRELELLYGPIKFNGEVGLIESVRFIHPKGTHERAMDDIRALNAKRRRRR